MLSANIHDCPKDHDVRHQSPRLYIFFMLKWHMSMDFVPVIYFKMPTIVGILKCITRTNEIFYWSVQKMTSIVSILILMNDLKFRALVNWAWKRVCNHGPSIYLPHWRNSFRILKLIRTISVKIQFWFCCSLDIISYISMASSLTHLLSYMYINLSQEKCIPMNRK